MSAIRIILFVFLISLVSAIIGKYLLLWLVKLGLIENKFFKNLIVKSKVEEDIEDIEIEAEVDAEIRNEAKK